MNNKPDITCSGCGLTMTHGEYTKHDCDTYLNEEVVRLNAIIERMHVDFENECIVRREYAIKNDTLKSEIEWLNARNDSLRVTLSEKVETSRTLESKLAKAVDALERAQAYIEDGSPLPMDLDDPYYPVSSLIDQALSEIKGE